MNGRLGHWHRWLRPSAKFGVPLLMAVFSFVLPVFASGAWVIAVQFVLWFSLLFVLAFYKGQADAKRVTHSRPAEAKIDGPFDQWYWGFPRSGRFGLWALLTVGFGMGGWFLGHRFWHDPPTGAIAGLLVLVVVYGVTDAAIRLVIVDSIITFFLGVPLIYTLVLLAQLPLLAFGLVPFSMHTYLVNPIRGALVGTGLSVLFNLKGTLSASSESGSDDGRAALHRLFLAGVELRLPVAFLIAALFIVPGHKPAALIILGALWGIVAAGVLAVFTVLVDHETVRSGWPLIALVEIVLMVGGLITVLPDYSRLGLTLALVLPAAIACAVTYGVVDLIATATSLLRGAPTVPATRPALTLAATGPDHPALPRRRDLPVGRPRQDGNRGRSPDHSRRAHRSKRRPRRRR